VTDHHSSPKCFACCVGWLALLAACAGAQGNLLANPSFEQLDEQGFFADWGRGEFGKVGKTAFVETDGAHEGKHCLRLVGTPNTWTTCAATNLAVKPETSYWVTWWFKAEQPLSSRTYLFLQTNLAQRVFPQTDRRGALGWALCLAQYRTQPGETSLHPVLTMQTSQDEVGISWWDEVGVWEKLPPALEALYRRDHPWDDVSSRTAQRLAQTDPCVVWGDRPEVRVYPQTPVPHDATETAAISLTAPGNGHDVFQLVVTPTRELAPVSLQFSPATGPGTMPTSALTCRVARCVPVQEVRDKSFPLGPTPDPLVEATEPEPVAPGKSALFWIEWAPPAGSKPGEYKSSVTVLSDRKDIATVPLRLRRWGFDLPAVPHYRSMVLVSASLIRQYYPGMSEEGAYRLAWDALSQHRLSGFNVALWPTPSLKDGKLEVDWTRFDRIIAAAKEYRATALTLGPMFGGGCGEGWKPRLKFVGFEALADPGFDAPYVELNRQVAERLRRAGLLDKAYVYPYDEPESDYMDKIARLCDLIHQGAPDLKTLMTTDPATGKPLWGKVTAWIIPSSSLQPDLIAERRKAGDEVWVYNMTAAIEASPLAHRLYMWRALRVDAAGGLLWNSCWWNKINPWENPTSAPVAVGRDGKGLYHYQAGQASLFYPALDGKGPLVPALRLLLIRQGVEDFDTLTELTAAWRRALSKLSATAKGTDLVAKARAAYIAPVMLDLTTSTTSVARVEAIREIVGNELEAATTAPAVIAYPIRADANLAVAGYAEAGTKVTVNGKPVPVDGAGRFQLRVTEQQLAAGLRWQAVKGAAKKTWAWCGLR